MSKAEDLTPQNPSESAREHAGSKLDGAGSPDRSNGPDPSVRSPVEPDVGFDMSDIPPQAREQITQFMAMSGPMPRGPDRLLSKIPEEQAYSALCKILENAGEKNERLYQGQLEELKVSDRQHVRHVLLVAAGLLVVTAIILTSIFMNKDELAKTLVPLLAGLVAGGAGGYGLGKSARE